MTIVVSIAIHKVNTSEKLVKKFKLSHIILNTINVIKKDNGSKNDAIRDSLNHTNTSIVKNTKITVVIAIRATPETCFQLFFNRTCYFLIFINKHVFDLFVIKSS